MDTKPNPEITVIHAVEPNETCKLLVEEHYNHRRLTRMDNITDIFQVNDGEGTLLYNCFVEIVTENYE